MLYPDIFNYMLHQSAHTVEELKPYNFFKAYNQPLCGWVKDIGYMRSAGHVVDMFVEICFMN